MVEEINRSRADVVWVGIGVPKQEKWMAQMRPRLEAPLLVGVGAAFDFHAGLVPQAPNWLQEAGLEWAYRLAQEPRRLCAAVRALQPALRGRLRPAAGAAISGTCGRAEPAAQPRTGPDPRPGGDNPAVPGHPTASVVIPTRARHGYLTVTLESIAPQAQRTGAEVSS